MSYANTRTVEQVVQPIAERRKPCPSCAGTGGTPLGLEYCPRCNGTGQVAEFPMLREPCHCCEAHDQVEGMHEEKCLLCETRGWLLVVTTDALLEAVWKAGFVAVMRPGAVLLFRPNRWNDYSGEPWGEGEGKPGLALALEAALKQEAADASR